MNELDALFQLADRAIALAVAIWWIRGCEARYQTVLELLMKLVSDKRQSVSMGADSHERSGASQSESAA